MQDRSYAIVFAVVIAICCLGAYVAVTGFWNTRPPTNPLDLVKAVTPMSFLLPTETAAPTKAGSTLAPPPTVSSNATPLGVIGVITQTATALTPIPLGSLTGVPTAAPTAMPSPTTRPTSPPPPTPVGQACVNYQFCPYGGPPAQDPRLMIGGIACPATYIWGRVIDKNGAGLAGVRIQFKGPAGELFRVESKGPPDEPGIYNHPAGNFGGPYTFYVLDSAGGQASPQITVVAPQGYGGSGNCPTRVDFRAQR